MNSDSPVLHHTTRVISTADGLSSEKWGFSIRCISDEAWRYADKFSLTKTSVSDEETSLTISSMSHFGRNSNYN